MSDESFRGFDWLRKGKWAERWAGSNDVELGKFEKPPTVQRPTAPTHALAWGGNVWRCSCGEEFSDDIAGIIAFDQHVPDNALAYYRADPNSEDPDAGIRDAWLFHALATRITAKRPWFFPPRVADGRSGRAS